MAAAASHGTGGAPWVQAPSASGADKVALKEAIETAARIAGVIIVSSAEETGAVDALSHSA